MSNYYVNIRFGTRHFIVYKNWKCTFQVNPYFLENKPEPWFKIY